MHVQISLSDLMRWRQFDAHANRAIATYSHSMFSHFSLNGSSVFCCNFSLAHYSVHTMASFLFCSITSMVYVWCAGWIVSDEFSNTIQWSSDYAHHLVHGNSFYNLPEYDHSVVEVASFLYFFNSDQYHPAGMTPKKTSRTACRRKGFIMYKGTEHKADLGHFILVTAAVCRKVR